MIMRLERWQHILASLLLSLFALVAVYLVLTLPSTLILSKGKDRAYALQRDIQHYHATKESINRLENHINHVLNELWHSSYFLHNETPALAAADMQRYLKDIIVNNNGQIISSQSIIRNHQSGFPHVINKIRMRGDINIVQKVLYDISTADFRMKIDHLKIQQDTSTLQNVSHHETALDVYFHVNAYMNALTEPDW